eukprot:GFUD01026371.1.p1 GENE.GFUD01026371.1~~GFUD01026371.1.p1  ORF type:complete len:162 (+),score=72.98 GFUD01026371.1:122-607(+)
MMGDGPGGSKDQAISANKEHRSNKEKVKKSPSEKSARPDKNTSRVWFSPAEYQLRQSLPPQLPRRPTDIYLTSNCEKRELLEFQDRAIRLLQEGDTVWLHSLGSNISNCITLTNTLSKELTKLEVDSFTQTWELSDNWGSVEEEVGPRYNSGLHVRCRVGQ